MKIILQQNVAKLGKAGDIVEASPGYFRNYLQPRRLAVLATDGALKKREEDLETLKKKADKAHQETLSLCEKIAALGTVRIGAKVGDGGKLYGKITNKEIAQIIEKKIGVEVDKRLIKTDDIGALGTYKAVVKLASDAVAELTVEVVLEGTEDKPPKAAKEEKEASETDEAEQSEEDLVAAE